MTPPETSPPDLSRILAGDRPFCIIQR